MQNHQLFTEAYLDQLRSAPIAADVVGAGQQTIREWREEFGGLEKPSELRGYLAQCFSALGFSYQRDDATGTFTLFADETHSQALGICLAVTDENIGRMVKGAHYQVKLVRLLREKNLAWGILSNGRDWRLCWAKSPAPYEVWLQGNLEGLLEAQQLAQFGMFYRFFSREAFGFREESRQGLDALLATSEASTQAIERHLKNRVDEVLDALCLGFVADEAGRKLGRAELDEIYRNTIYLLYRVLFLFYAEARELLPVDDEAYQRIGLEGLIEASKRWQVDGARESDEYSLWKRLTHLCVVVDDGSEESHVNPYNGGLFSDSEKPYLRQHKIKNDFLAPALFDLAFMQTRDGAARRIDYRDLSVRHLGTLYEGMLEYRLNLVEDEPVVVRASKGKQVFVPQSQAGAIKKGETILEPGKVYFADDKGERKSSGSYYTPEDVVQYIGANTLLPKLQERTAGLAALAAEAERERALAVNETQRAATESYFDRKLLELVERELLSLKILDPAMGSAHFLVAAGQMLTNFIVETLNALDWVNESISTDPLVWKRRVVERCLYGVDVNPLAQELAKLALWLTSAAQGKPLTFLDHHLKVGNSLYGAPLTRLASLPTAKTAPGSDDMFRLAYQKILGEVLGQLANITASDSEHIEDVKGKGKAYHAAQAQARRLRDVADVWLATLFDLTKADGKPLDEATYFTLLTEATRERSPEDWDAFVDGLPVVRQARQIAIQNQFLHWELEFPEVLVGDKCAFDVIIANPPYVKTHAEKPILKLFTTAKCADLYAWITERALDVLGQRGILGTIIPLSIIFAGDKISLRKLVLAQKADTYLISCDNNPDAIFESPGSARNRQRTTIAIIKRTNNSGKIYTTDYLRWLRSERPLLFQNIKFADTTSLASENFFLNIGSDALVDFMKSLNKCSKTVGDYVVKDGADFLCVQSAACYFVAAVPVNLGRRNQELLWFESKDIADKMFAILNSNVFYWYWRSRSDGFWVSREQILSMPVPSLEDIGNDLISLSKHLWESAENAAVRQNFNGTMVTTYYFNRQMETLLAIDEWLVKRIAPELSLTKDIFAQYKSNTFLRPLDLSQLQEEDLETEE